MIRYRLQDKEEPPLIVILGVFRLIAQIIISATIQSQLWASLVINIMLNPKVKFLLIKNAKSTLTAAAKKTSVKIQTGRPTGRERRY